METSDPATWTAPEYPRADEPFTGPERAMLDGFLDWHRASLLRRCTGLTCELMYDLPCHRGHHVLATAPQITRAVRRAKGNWADLNVR